MRALDECRRSGAPEDDARDEFPLPVVGLIAEYALQVRLSCRLGMRGECCVVDSCRPSVDVDPLGNVLLVHCNTALLLSPLDGMLRSFGQGSPGGTSGWQVTAAIFSAYGDHVLLACNREMLEENAWLRHRHDDKTKPSSKPVHVAKCCVLEYTRRGRFVRQMRLSSDLPEEGAGDAVSILSRRYFAVDEDGEGNIYAAGQVQKVDVFHVDRRREFEHAWIRTISLTGPTDTPMDGIALDASRQRICMFDRDLLWISRLDTGGLLCVVDRADIGCAPDQSPGFLSVCFDGRGRLFVRSAELGLLLVGLKCRDESFRPSARVEYQLSLHAVESASTLHPQSHHAMHVDCGNHGIRLYLSPSESSDHLMDVCRI